MITLLLTVFVASLLGSLHCAGMCGPFVAFAVGDCGSRRLAPRPAAAPVSPAAQCDLVALPGLAERIVTQSAYHLGRLATYVLLGAAAGAVGAAVDLSASLAGVQRFAAVLAGTMMILAGLATVARCAGLRLDTLAAPRLLQRPIALGHRAAVEMPPSRRAVVVGLLTTLLPCGWLYAFALAAAGAGDPLLGAAVMLAFWLGTVPVLTFIGAGAFVITSALGQRLPLLTSAAIITLGVLTVVQRAAISPRALTALSADRPVSIEAAARHAAALDSAEMPCCKDEPR